MSARATNESGSDMSETESCSSSDESEVESVNAFALELDKNISLSSASQWIQFMQWCPNMDVLALVMRQKDSQQLWLQRCGGKWQNLHTIDIQTELCDPSLSVCSLSWRPDGAAISLGLSNGKIAQFSVENGREDGSILKIEFHDSSIIDAHWMSHSVNRTNPISGNIEIKSANVSQQRSADLNSQFLRFAQSTTAASTDEKEIPTPESKSVDAGVTMDIDDDTIVSGLCDASLSSLRFNDRVTRFVGRIPALPTPFRVDFKFKMDSDCRTLDYWMKQRSKPPLSNRVPPKILPLIVTVSEENRIKIHASSRLCVGDIDLTDKPMSTADDVSFNAIRCQLSSDLKHLSIIRAHNQSHLCFQSIHTPLYHSRRNEIITITHQAHCIETLLQHLHLINLRLDERWKMATKSTQLRIRSLEEECEKFYGDDHDWKFHFKHTLSVGTPSQAMLQYIEKYLNTTALERSQTQLQQCYEEMLSIIETNGAHIVHELILRMSELHGYSLWMERFGCIGLQTKKIEAFLKKLKVLYLKFDKLRLLLSESKQNLEAFGRYLLFLAGAHSPEETCNVGFDQLDVRRIYTAIDFDLKPNRVTLFLRNATLPTHVLASINELSSQHFWDTPKQLSNESIFESLTTDYQKYERYSLSYLIFELRRNWKTALADIHPTISDTFEYNNQSPISNIALLRPSLNNHSRYSYRIRPETISFSPQTHSSQKDTNNTYLFCFAVQRTHIKTEKSETRLVFLSLQTCISSAKREILSNANVWTDDFSQFQQLISTFAAKANTEKVSMCSVELIESRLVPFVGISLIATQFISADHISLLCNTRSETGEVTSLDHSGGIGDVIFEEQSIFGIIAMQSLPLTDIDCNDDTIIGEMAFNANKIATVQISMDDIQKRVLNDSNGVLLSVCGARKLAAVGATTVGTNAGNKATIDNVKCNRLLVVDISALADNEDDSYASDSEEKNESGDESDNNSGNDATMHDID